MSCDYSGPNLGLGGDSFYRQDATERKLNRKFVPPRRAKDMIEGKHVKKTLQMSLADIWKYRLKCVPEFSSLAEPKNDK